ncbi:MAG: hypothetical protein V7L22_00040 [Nostoc sp.]
MTNYQLRIGAKRYDYVPDTLSRIKQVSQNIVLGEQTDEYLC